MDCICYCLEVNKDLYVNVDGSIVYKQKKRTFFTKKLLKKYAFLKKRTFLEKSVFFRKKGYFFYMLK